MNRRSLIFSIIASALISALVTSLIAMKWHDHNAPGHHPADVSDRDFHHWLHHHLALTETQEKALHPVEVKFEEEQKLLRDEVLKAADALAHEIRRNDPESPALEEALARLNQSQGKLQKLSLDHFFEMKRQLTPEQAEKLLQWTHDSIVGNHSH